MTISGGSIQNCRQRPKRDGPKQRWLALSCDDYIHVMVGDNYLGVRYGLWTGVYAGGVMAQGAARPSKLDA